MTLSETRKSWLSTNFFPTGLVAASSVMNAILSDLNNTTDVDIPDITWMYQSIGSTYSPVSADYEDTGKVTEIVSGNSIRVLLYCPLGQVCDLTPILIVL